jgi:hypothetical protein
MYSLRIIAALSILISGLSTCRNTEGVSPSGCCGMPAFNQAVGNGHLYIPNIFTPDGDGINDELVWSATNLVYIRYIEIKDIYGKVVLYGKNWPLNGLYWDGTIDQKVKKGLYLIKMVIVTDNGLSEEVEARVCNYPCGQLKDHELIEKTSCQFGDQVDQNLVYQPFIPTAEPSYCFPD